MRKQLENLESFIKGSRPKFQGTSTDGQVKLEIKKDGEKTITVKTKDNEGTR